MDQLCIHYCGTRQAHILELHFLFDEKIFNIVTSEIYYREIQEKSIFRFHSFCFKLHYSCVPGNVESMSE